MDHDAMLTHVNKLKQFRDDFLTMSDTTAEKLHEMAERVRAGENRLDVSRSMSTIDEDGEQFGYDKNDEPKRPGEQLPPIDGHLDGTDKGDPTIDQSQGTDPAINPLTGLPVGSQEGEKPELVGMQGDTANSTGEAIKPV